MQSGDVPAAAVGAGAGGVELREDVPLKGGGGGGSGGGAGAVCGGARGVQACFGALSCGIALALLAQVLGGGGAGAGGGGTAHGAVSAGAAACSRAGAQALQAGGRALDAAAAAALCLALATPRYTSLDASGALLLWQYRTEHARAPLLAQWGAAGQLPPRAPAAPAAPAAPRAPRLLCALAALHAVHGALAWPRLLQPARDLIAAESPLTPEHALLADYLRRAQNVTSAELSSSEGCSVEGAGGGVRLGAGEGERAGSWRVWGVGGAAGRRVGAALAHALQPAPPPPPPGLDMLDAAVLRAAQSLAAPATTAPAAASPAPGPASGLAVVDHLDTYVAMVTGLSAEGADGATGGESGEGWRYDEPSAPLDLAPAIFAEERVCGSRFVVGAESSAALAQAGAALLAGGGGGGAEGVERARLRDAAGGGLEPDGAAPPPPALLALAQAHSAPASAARAPAVNVVIQRGDALASHADSRAGGLASRF